MKIFVGSSLKYVMFNTDGTVDVLATQTNSKLYPIITHLRNEGHIVEPWWENSVLASGTFILDTLIEKAHKCDAGIFVFTTDDLLKDKNSKGGNLFVPRGNVLVECGMFYGAKSQQRTFPLKDGNFDNIKIPTDIIGNKLGDINDADILTQLTDFFDNKKLNSENRKITFYFNNESTNILLKKDYEKWCTKLLYIGSESARRWKAIEEDHNYLIDTDEVKKFVEGIHSNPNININYSNINNIISLGPGCGKFDDEIVSEVYQYNKFISYVAIDINPYLAFEASKYIKKENPELRIPFAIVDDFEENDEYVGEILDAKFHKNNQTNLFMMLGGTFSNLEGTEKNIARKIESWMSKKDYFILDAFIKEDTYNFSQDSNRQVNNLPKSYQELIINSLIKRFLTKNIKSNFIEEVKVNLPDFLEGAEVSNKKPYSNINETSVVTYKARFDKHSNFDKDILVAKRYKFSELYNYLSSNFKILYSFDGLSGHINKSDRGIFLLQKK